MATTKTIQTRIKNRFDTLEKWQVPGVSLLPGEIALVSVTTQKIDQATGDVVEVPAVLMKVGEANEYNSDGSVKSCKTFSELPWVSALAADVYDWAKKADPSTITVKYRTGGTDAAPKFSSATLADVLKDLEAAKADIAAFTTNILDSISVDPKAPTANGVVQGVTYDSKTGKFTVSYDLVATDDINALAVTEAKIAADAVTTSKIKDSAVTNEKIDKVSATKVEVTPAIQAVGEPGDENYIPAKSAVMLDTKLGALDASIAEINRVLTGGTHFIGKTNEQPYVKESVTYVKLETVVEGATSYPETKANAGDIVIYIGTDAAHGAFEKEFISTGSEWQELGDLGRVGTLETLTSGLIEDKSTANQFVTYISKDAETGTLVVNKARPTGDDVLYETRTEENNPNPVNVSVNDKFSEVDGKIAAIAENYVKISGDSLVDQDGLVIIFDCGGAPTV
jgi:hypothetical protein